MNNHHHEGLVLFIDLTRYHRLVKDATFEKEAAILTQFVQITHDTVAEHGVTLIKYISDSGLGFFPEAHIDAGIDSLLQMKHRPDQRRRDGSENPGFCTDGEDLCERTARESC